MTSITLGVFGEDIEKRRQIASGIAKKGSEEDITQYQTVYSGKIITVIEPSKYPEKVLTLAYCAYLSDYCIIVGEELTPRLGEIIITLDLLGKTQGCFVTNLDLTPLVKGTSLEKFAVFSSFDDAKEKILEASRAQKETNDVFASVDHSFEVKGVGSILLGFLHSGKILIHDKLVVHPSGKELEVRSIQMHDQDVKETSAGDRFGLAIKLLTSKDVDRGDMLAGKETAIKNSKEHGIKISINKFVKEQVKDGEQLHAIHFLEDAPFRWNGPEISGGTESTGKLIFEKPFSIRPDYPVLIVRLDAKGLRVIGRASAI
ncbi:MAG: EF-Tu/IF-2/RF-3 family GTPase [Candidatus Micrarchaeota archaeon]